MVNPSMSVCLNLKQVVIEVLIRNIGIEILLFLVPIIVTKCQIGIASD